MTVDHARAGLAWYDRNDREPMSCTAHPSRQRPDRWRLWSRYERMALFDRGSLGTRPGIAPTAIKRTHDRMVNDT